MSNLTFKIWAGICILANLGLIRMAWLSAYELGTARIDHWYVKLGNLLENIVTFEALWFVLMLASSFLMDKLFPAPPKVYK
jgi:hypothetical protein